MADGRARFHLLRLLHVQLPGENSFVCSGIQPAGYIALLLSAHWNLDLELNRDRWVFGECLVVWCLQFRWGDDEWDRSRKPLYFSQTPGGELPTCVLALRLDALSVANVITSQDSDFIGIGCAGVQARARARSCTGCSSPLPVTPLPSLSPQLCDLGSKRCVCCACRPLLQVRLRFGRGQPARSRHRYGRGDFCALVSDHADLCDSIV